MAKTVISVGAVVGLGSTITSAKNTVGNVKSSFYSTRCQVDGRIANRNNIGNRLSSISSQLSNIENRIFNIKNTVERSANSYRSTDAKVVAWKNAVVGKVSGLGYAGIGAAAFAVAEKTKQSNKKAKVNEKTTGDFSLWSWKDTWKLVGSGGIIGSIISAVGGAITGGVSVSNGLNTTKGVAKIIENIAKAVPKTSNASFDWKTLFGFTGATKDLPKNFGDAFGETFKKNFKFSNAKTVSKKVEVGAKWAGYGLTAITTAYDNFTDTSENNSAGRKVAETIGETAIKLGEGWVIGAGVTAIAAATVGAPAVVIGGVTVLAIWAIDKGCEALTGKSFAEWASDGILDFGEKAINKVGSTAKKVTGAISGWWKKTFG